MNFKSILSRGLSELGRALICLLPLAAAVNAFLSFLPNCHAASLEELDAICRKANSLDEFLRRQDLVDEYFHGLQEYYGPDKFPRKSFDATVTQLKLASAQIPGLSKRLWETTGLGQSFSVHTSVKSSGRTIESSKWRDYQQRWLHQLEVNSGPYAKMTEAAGLARAKEAVNNIESRVTSFETSISGLKKSDRSEQSAKFYKALRSEPEFVQTSAFLLRRHVTSEATQDLLGSNDADLILDTLSELRQNPAKALTGVFDHPPSGLLAQIRQQTPDAQSLLADESIFPRIRSTTTRGRSVLVGSGPASNFDFVPIPRRIHGIWKGISLGECVGGECRSIDKLSPERWATIALKDSRLYHLERAGSYLGFVQIVPITKDGKTYGSVDFGAPALKQRAVQTDPVTGKKTTSTLYDLWLKSQMTERPKPWSGLIVGESYAINNAGVLGTVRDSASYSLGYNVGPSKSFTHPDPMAAKIVSFSEQAVTKRNGYGGNMMYPGRKGGPSLS